MPTPHTAPEQTLAIAGALGAAAAAVAGTVIALAVTDGTTALAVGTGAGLVALLGVLVLPLYRLVAAVGNDMVVGLSVAALGLRVAVAMVATAIVSSLGLLPIRRFAIGLAVGLVCALVAEMAAAARDPRFFWVQVPATTTPLSPRSDRAATPPRSGDAPIGADRSPLRSDTERQLT